MSPNHLFECVKMNKPIVRGRFWWRTSTSSCNSTAIDPLDTAMKEWNLGHHSTLETSGLGRNVCQVTY